MSFDSGRIPEIYSRFPHLADFLRRYCAGDSSNKITRYLVHVAAFIAKRYLGRRLHAANRYEDCGIEQVAISVTVNLFRKSENGVPLCKRLDPVLHDDSLLVSSFLQYSITVIRNELHAWLKTVDPEGFNLTERINEALEKPEYCLWPDKSPEWVKKVDTTDLNLSGQPWSAPDIALLACSEAGPRVPDTPSWLRAVMASVSTSEVFQRFVNIDVLSEGLRLASAQLLGNVSVGDVAPPKLNPWLVTKLHEQIGRALVEGRAYLDNYRNRQKLGDNGLGVLHRALEAYFDDVKTKGENPISQFEYVKESHPGLTREYYDQHFKAAFEGAVACVWKGLKGK